MNESELDCILFDYRGLKFTYRLRPHVLDVNGEIVSDFYFGDDSVMRAEPIDRLFQHGDMIADELARRREPTPGLSSPPLPTAAPHQSVPPSQHTRYAPPSQAAETCPDCGWPGKLVNKSWGVDLECTNPNHKNDRGYPHKIRKWS